MCLDLFRSQDDALGTARLLEMLGRLEAYRGHLNEAEMTYLEAKSIFEEHQEKVSLVLFSGAK
jgi:hypothetical protein